MYVHTCIYIYIYRYVILFTYHQFVCSLFRNNMKSHTTRGYECLSYRETHDARELPLGSCLSGESCLRPEDMDVVYVTIYITTLW